MQAAPEAEATKAEEPAEAKATDANASTGEKEAKDIKGVKFAEPAQARTMLRMSQANMNPMN